jgi:hypothetical protein
MSQLPSGVVTVSLIVGMAYVLLLVTGSPGSGP